MINQKLLLFLQGCFAFSGRNNIDDTLEGDTGDAMLYNGILLSSPIPFDNANELKTAVTDSFDAQCRPYRCPNYVGKDTVNTFSRDMLIGFLHYLITTKDSNLASEFYAWLKSNRMDMCAGSATDNRGKITPSMWGIIGDVWAYVGLNRPWYYWLWRWSDGVVLLLSAMFTPKGYQKHLISQHIWLRYRIGVKSRLISRVLYWSDKDNDWYKLLSELNGKNRSGVYKEILSKCNDKEIEWKGPGDDWLLTNPRCKEPCGHDILFLQLFIKYLLEI